MNMPMLAAMRAGAVLIATGLLAACASGPEIRADFDRSVDFKTYKTFGFVSPLGTDREGYQSIVSQHLKSAARSELEARGLSYSETNPQLLVNFNAKFNEKMRVDTVPATGYGYYGYRAGYYGAWPMYAQETYVSTYTEGTLNVDVVDATRKQLVWEGVAVGRVNAKSTDDIKPRIDETVGAIFAKYPIPRADAPAK